METSLWSGCLAGAQAHLIRVEIDLQSGLPSFGIVGLPDATVRESRDRVRSAIKNSDLSFPMKRITINLIPGDLKKVGSSFELAIAVGLIYAHLEWKFLPSFGGSLFLGELSLHGHVLPIRGVLPLILEAKRKGFKTVFIPEANRVEAQLVSGVEIYGLSTLTTLLQFLKEEITLVPIPYSVPTVTFSEGLTLSDVKGQVWGKRALAVSAAGGHPLMMIGPPGCGKTMLAKRLPSLLPPLGEEELLEVSKIHSLFGPQKEISIHRPFRSPHHTVSYAGLIGGGTSTLLPGEISLAHHGILFLDEFPEFRRDVLEALREPLEEKKISIIRHHGRAIFPADFLLVAAMNPCPCGWNGDPKRECLCLETDIERYLKKISGPLLDRIDCQVTLSSVPMQDISKKQSMGSQDLKEAVCRARQTQAERFKTYPWKLNALIPPKYMESFCGAESSASSLLIQMTEQFGWSLRTYHRLLKVSRTLADLEGAPQIRRNDISQAIQLRSLDQA